MSTDATRTAQDFDEVLRVNLKGVFLVLARYHASLTHVVS